MADVVAGWKHRGETRGTAGERGAHPMPEERLQPRTRPAPRSFRLGIGMANLMTPNPVTMRRCRAHDILPHRIEIRLAKPLNQFLTQRPTEDEWFKAGGINKPLGLRMIEFGLQDGVWLRYLARSSAVSSSGATRR